MFYPLIGDINIGNFISGSVKHENTIWILSRKQRSARGQRK